MAPPAPISGPAAREAPSARRWVLLLGVVAAVAVAALGLFVSHRAPSPSESAKMSAREIPEIPEIEGLGELDPRFAAALTEAVAAIRRQPGNGALFGRLGMLYHAHKYYAAARRAYEIAGELEPESADWPYYVALLASGRGETELATSSLRRVLELEPDNLAARLRLGNLLFGDDQLEAAAELYRELSRQAPEAPWGWVGQAKVLRRQGDLTGAQRLLEQAVALAPEDREGTYLLAMVYRERGEIARSAPLLAGVDERVRAWPPDPRMERIEEGRRDLQSLVKEANALLADGNTAAAETLYREVLKSEAGHFDALFNLGVLYGRTGRYAQAEEVLKAAIHSKPDDAQAHYVLAMAYASQRRFEEAGAELERVLELDPEHEEARAVLNAATP